jgi:cephalosporin hydroxylase
MVLIDEDILHNAIQWRRKDRSAPTWRMVGCQQFPADLWRYAELCFALEPPFVIEVGVATGGTTLFLADVLSLMGGACVYAIDVNLIPVQHPRLVPLLGDSVSDETIAEVTRIAAGRRGLVLLDGDHKAGHVARELDLYAPLADYLVVEDTIMEWLPEFPGGPLDALNDWLPHHPEFTADPDPIPGPTQHPGGWLRRTEIAS